MHNELSKRQVKMNYFLKGCIFFALMITSFLAKSQRVGIGTNNPQAALDITSTKDGLLLPRLTTIQRDSIQNPPEGLMIYNTTLHCVQAYQLSGWMCTDGTYADPLGRFLAADFTDLTTICSTPNNGVIVGGSFGPYAKLIKLNSKGQKQWIRLDTSGGLNTYMYVKKVISLSTGNIVSVGINRQTSSAYVLQIDSSATTVWYKEFVGASAFSLVEMPDGNIVVCGSATGRTGNHGGPDIWLAKLETTTGNLIWEKSIGGSLADEAYDISCLNNNTNFAIVGSTASSDADFSGKVNHGLGDGFVMKLFGNGNIYYSTIIGGSMSDILTSISAVNDNEFVVGGVTSSNDGDVVATNPNAFSSAWVLKITSGNVDWQKKTAFYYNSVDKTVSVQKASDGNFFVLSTVLTDKFAFAYEQSDFYVQKFTPAGIELWKTIIGGSDLDNAITACMLPNGKLVIAGESWSSNVFMIPTPPVDKKNALFKINDSGTVTVFSQ